MVVRFISRLSLRIREWTIISRYVIISEDMTWLIFGLCSSSPVCCSYLHLLPAPGRWSLTHCPPSSFISFSCQHWPGWRTWQYLHFVDCVLFLEKNAVPLLPVYHFSDSTDTAACCASFTTRMTCAWLSFSSWAFNRFTLDLLKSTNHFDFGYFCLPFFLTLSSSASCDGDRMFRHCRSS